MLADLVDAPEVADQHFDVAILGGGAAGISVARQLTKAGHRVCLAESGGLDFEERTQALYTGSNIGHEYYDLDQSRLRFFGGTLSIWGGRCAMLDEIDFRKRDWVPHSGWPITRNDLIPWYRKAHDMFELGEFEWEDTARLCGIPELGFDPTRLATSLWRFDEANERFAAEQVKDLIDNPNLTILLHANATRLIASGNAAKINMVEVKSLDGQVAKIKAEHFVIACGAIENSRLLLASNDVVTAGIGNQHDQVGRCFMEHPCGRIAKISTSKPFELWAAYRKRFMRTGPPIAPVLRLADDTQQAEGALNSAITLKLQRPPEMGVALGNKLYHNIKHSLDPSRKARALNHYYRGLRAWFHRNVRNQIEALRANRGITNLYMMVRGEQPPNPNSRIILSDQRDELEVPYANLDWRFDPLEKHTAKVLTRIMDAEMTRLGHGKVEPSDWLSEAGEDFPVDPTVGNHPIAGYHHMGGTRMSEDPKNGVVDADCKVHGVSNLHVAGSSVFPTGGWANPTFTLTALALRLADRLDETIKSN